MSMPRTLLSILTGLLLTASLHAQIEPQLRTHSDSLDVYKTDASKSNAICVFDFTTLSRAVFEPSTYLTTNGRNRYLANAGITGIDCNLTQGKDYGVIFLLKNGTANVVMYRWPQSSSTVGFYGASGWTGSGSALVGTPLNFTGSGDSQTKASVTALATDNATIGQITHVRFSINGRSVDLPCPSRIWDSPYLSDSGSAATNSTAPYNNAVANFQHNTAGTGGPVYDPWSNNHPVGIDPSSGGSLRNIPAGYTPIGNFYYSFDYLAWIFGSKEIGNGFCWSTAPTAGNYASPNGYAVPATNESTTVPGIATKQPAEGWFNGLPCMTRYQADKVAAINVYLAKADKVNLVYRYLDGRIDNSANSEEGGTNWISTSAPNDANRTQASLWSDATIANRKYFRLLSNNASTGLPTNNTSLQQMGPSGWTQAYTGTPGSYDALNDFIEASGNNDPCKLDGGSMDPRTPMPWAYTLVNTYYRAAIEPTVHDMNDIFPDSAAGSSCPSQNFVIIFPTGGFSDSTATGAPTSISEDAAIIYGNKTGAIPSGNGGLPQIKGSYPGASSACQGPGGTGSLAPLDETFHPAALASVAAFANAASNSYQWSAPWEVNPSATRSSSNPGIKTMVMGVGIPGSVYCGSSHNLRSAAAQFFRIAQWSDPQRTDLGYGKWYSDKPGNDTSIVDPSNPGKVHYYPSGSPSQLEANFKAAMDHIVAGSASLSAPATPSTGARVTSQAYFGIFRTSRTPVWSGNLYSVGIRFALNAAGTEETMSFYDANGNSTIATYTPVDNNNDPILGADGKPLVVTGTNDFDGHHLWSAFDIFGTYLAGDYTNGVAPQTTGVAGSPLLWSARRVYTLSGTSMVSFSPTNTSLVSTLVSQFTTANLFPASDSSSSLKTTHVQNFIKFILGQNRNTAHTDTNRVDIMGDIVNSSPVAVELSSTNLSDLPSSITWPSSGTDPHVRLILVGSNMGQLHCFAESASKDSSGNVKAKATEAWSFIPPDVINTLFQVYLNDGVDDVMPHTYTVDGNPSLFWSDLAPSGSVIGNTRVDANEDGIIIFGMRKGGRSRYALSLTAKNGGTPGMPKFLWKLDPNSSTDDTVKKMGASSGDPAFGFYTTNGNPKTSTAVAFLTGGYANPEINARYRARTSPPITAAQGMGQSVLALNPYDGSIIKKWDWSDSTTIGSIPGEPSPLGIFSGSPLIYRLYFADMKGNVMALDTSAKSSSTTASGYRIDSSIISSWNSAPRFIYSNSAFRFSTRPEVMLLPNGYPVPIAAINGSTTPNYRPLTAMVAIGSGDWNNPTDTDESVTDGTITLTNVHTPATNRMFVFADRQDSYNQGVDTAGIPDTSLQEIKDTSDSTFNWTTTLTDDRVIPGSTTYLFKNKTGYYYDLLDATLPSAYNGITHDKVLVSPLISNGVIFFSIFSIQGNTGFQCSSNAFTRTFRECDLLRPLGIDSQVQQASTVADINQLNLNTDTCSGLAFYFNSLASEMSIAGDRVIQGGAVTAATGSGFGAQTGSNTASLQESRQQPGASGLQLRSWRIAY
jgi:hypothetical protein